MEIVRNPRPRKDPVAIENLPIEAIMRRLTQIEPETAKAVMTIAIGCLKRALIHAPACIISFS